MPYIIKDFANEKGKISSSDFSTSNVTFQFYNRSSTIPNIMLVITEMFYTDLKSILSTTTLEITFDDENTSFTVFGMKFTVFCQLVSANSSYYSIIPVVYRERDYSVNCSFTRPTYNSTSSQNYYGMRADSSLCQYDSSRNINFNYRIRIHYNANCLHITYGPSYNLNTVFPVMCVIKGKTIEDRDILYLSGDCNTSTFVERNNTIYTLKYAYDYSTYNGTFMSMFHSLVYPDKPEITLLTQSNKTSESRYNINPFAIFDDIKRTEYNEHQNLLKEENRHKYLKKEPIAMGGMIHFDNILLASDVMVNNGYYTIGTDTYFCPGVDLAHVMEAAYGTNTKTQTHRLLLKL